MVQAIIPKPINDELQSQNKKAFSPFDIAITETVGMVAESPADAAAAELRIGGSLES
jgi:hypothetical protein